MQDGISGVHSPFLWHSLVVKPFLGTSLYPGLHLYCATEFTCQPMIAPAGVRSTSLLSGGWINPFEIVPLNGGQRIGPICICVCIVCLQTCPEEAGSMYFFS